MTHLVWLCKVIMKKKLLKLDEAIKSHVEKYKNKNKNKTKNKSL